MTYAPLSTNQASRSNEHDGIRKSEIDALVKMLKYIGNTLGNTYGYALRASRIASICDHSYVA